MAMHYSITTCTLLFRSLPRLGHGSSDSLPRPDSMTRTLHCSFIGPQAPLVLVLPTLLKGRLQDRCCKHCGEPNATLLHYLQNCEHTISETGTSHHSHWAGKMIKPYTSTGNWSASWQPSHHNKHIVKTNHLRHLEIAATGLGKARLH